ncbi:MAG: DUF1573 domain-containing protein [Syntrophomonadaceae bacterium]|nr:DUF1573 domain-containing protein [Syntrophomonadaceae bacterium]MDH7497321.1 DUF1573 domain-containing protein [Syntrophomonadaceae bacterium]
MKDLICDEFQNVVGELLIRHHSVLDVLSKLSESSARVNRAVCKSVTDCGCLAIEARKVQFPQNVETVDDLRRYLDDHLRGSLCPECEEILVAELGKCLFYTAALCNLLDLNLYDIFLKEYKRSTALGVFNMT